MGVDNKISYEGASLISLGAVQGSAGPIGSLVNAAQPEAMAIQGPTNAPTPRGMA